MLNKNTEKRVGIFWNFENVPQSEIASDLLEFARQRGEVVACKAYSCNWNESHKNHLEYKDFECIQVDNPDPIKNAADSQLVKDCLNYSADIKIVVSGDCGIHKKLNPKISKFIVFARRGSDCQSFKKTVFDQFYYTDELPGLVKNVSEVADVKLTFVTKML